MNERRVDGFFYGLFMDSKVLRNSGVVPENPRHGYVDGYRLRKATVQRCFRRWVLVRTEWSLHRAGTIIQRART